MSGVGHQFRIHSTLKRDKQCAGNIANAGGDMRQACWTICVMRWLQDYCLKAIIFNLQFACQKDHPLGGTVLVQGQSVARADFQYDVRIGL